MFRSIVISVIIFSYIVLCLAMLNAMFCYALLCFCYDLLYHAMFLLYFCYVPLCFAIHRYVPLFSCRVATE